MVYAQIILCKTVDRHAVVKRRQERRQPMRLSGGG
jgi:hypothetical protein